MTFEFVIKSLWALKEPNFSFIFHTFLANLILFFHFNHNTNSNVDECIVKLGSKMNGPEWNHTHFMAGKRKLHYRERSLVIHWKYFWVNITKNLVVLWYGILVYNTESFVHTTNISYILQKICAMYEKKIYKWFSFFIWRHSYYSAS